jgi:hypothetical protein
MNPAGASSFLEHCIVTVVVILEPDRAGVEVEWEGGKGFIEG